MTPGFRFAFVGLLVGLGALVACGDDEPVTVTPTPTPTRSSSSGDAGKAEAGAGDDDDIVNPPDPDGRKTTDPLRVFVTSESFTGALDGLGGADTKCKEAATAAAIKPTGRWAAWLGTTAEPVNDRILKSAGTLPYQLLDGTMIVAKASDLATKVGLLSAITLTETKKTEDGATLGAWTGTKIDGTGSANTCLAWTSEKATFDGNVGRVTAKNATWTDAMKADTCEKMNRLYCFEVP